MAWSSFYSVSVAGFRCFWHRGSVRLLLMLMVPAGAVVPQMNMPIVMADVVVRRQ